MQDAYLNFQKKQDRKIRAATFKHGIISAVYLQSWSADVIIEGDIQTILKNVPMSSAVPYTVQKGQLCRVDMFDESNPRDSIVAYTYGISPNPNFIVTSGSASVTNNQDPIAHGLGVVPDFYWVSAVGSTGGGYDAYPPNSVKPADITNLYVHQWGSPGTLSVDWMAVVVPKKNF